MNLQIFKEAQTLLPGGVNSPVRAFKSVGGQPIIFERVEGPYCFDVDGNKVHGSHACFNRPTCSPCIVFTIQVSLPLKLL